MAAPMLVSRLRSGLYPWKRALHSSALQCAAQDWRIKHGFARSGSEYGPLTDLPDWSFADGRPGPPWKGQIRRKEENKELARRIVLLSNEIDQGIKNWTEKQERIKEKQLLKQKNQLKAKAVFKKNSESQ
ncbi:39S ribosomal protein L52, mitochondrial [Bufo gargarizans]|uniref:39S ribosomal protein L52, mitochondrial n=1 Tax=Bufo gargarizans TaxID=30331 RepID=UPI001CF2CB30|nr:39S ribosomal protein L52, mitochondrial [Bufo gargarizans]